MPTILALKMTGKPRLGPRPTACENLSLSRRPSQAVHQGPARPGSRGPASAGLRLQSRAVANINRHNIFLETRALAENAREMIAAFGGENKTRR